MKIWISEEDVYPYYLFSDDGYGSVECEITEQELTTFRRIRSENEAMQTRLGEFNL